MERISNFIKIINEIKNKLENTTIIKELDSFINVIGKDIHKGALKMIVDYKENSVTFSFEKSTKNDSNEVYEILEIKIIYKKKLLLYIQKISDSIDFFLISDNFKSGNLFTKGLFVEICLFNNLGFFTIFS